MQNQQEGLKMNDIGFISGDMALATKGYGVSAIPINWTWDRQTIVILSDQSILSYIQRYLRSNRIPSSMTKDCNYQIDGFCNLNYNPRERDPAKRNVRIVYYDIEHGNIEEVFRRFQCSYIIRVERSECNGTSRISGEIPKISGR